MDEKPIPAPGSTLRPTELMLDREKAFLAVPGVLELLANHLANGGDVIDLCEAEGVRYGVVMGWVASDPVRQSRMREARLAWAEWGEQRIKSELQRLSFIDIRQLFNDDHSIKPPSQWPADLAAAVEAIEVSELKEFNADSKTMEVIGLVKKIKLAKKGEALKLLGQQLGMFVQKHEVRGTLEDLVAASLKTVTQGGTDAAGKG